MTVMSGKRRKASVKKNSGGRRITVNVQYACARGKLPDRGRIIKWVKAALDGTRAHAELTVRIVDEAEAAALSRRWRRRKESTNVLSFPAAGLERIAPGLLGDIVICAPLARREAREQGKKPEAHWAHLVIHGTLHLLGYDHETARDAKVMESLEVGVLERLGFANPYRG